MLGPSQSQSTPDLCLGTAASLKTLWISKPCGKGFYRAGKIACECVYSNVKIMCVCVCVSFIPQTKMEMNTDDLGIWFIICNYL